MSINAASNWKKHQAELLFDEFMKIGKRRGSLKAERNEVWLAYGSLQGDDVVADSPKRLSGTFSREIRTLQSRTPPLEAHELKQESESALDSQVPLPQCVDSSLSHPVAVGASACEVFAQEPSENLIHETAIHIADVGDEINDLYQKKLGDAKERIKEILNERGNSMPYQAFVALMSEVLPQDRDISTFYFVMHLSYHLVFQFRWSFNFFRQYISEKFSTEAATCIEEQSSKVASKR